MEILLYKQFAQLSIGVHRNTCIRDKCVLVESITEVQRKNILAYPKKFRASLLQPHIAHRNENRVENSGLLSDL